MTETAMASSKAGMMWSKCTVHVFDGQESDRSSAALMSFTDVLGRLTDVRYCINNIIYFTIFFCICDPPGEN